MNKNELQSQIDNLKLEFTDAVYSVVAMKVGRGDEKDVLSELAVKQTIKEALEKIARVYEFGMSDNEIFILGSNKKHDVGRITRTIDEAESVSAGRKLRICRHCMNRHLRHWITIW